MVSIIIYQRYNFYYRLIKRYYIMTIPAAIIFMNGDFNSLTQTTIATQLHLNEVMTKTEFDARVTVDPNYPQNVTLNSLRILVVLPSFQDEINRELADIVLFYKQGMISVERSRFGPPGLTLSIQRINIYDLLRDVGSSSVVILPITSTRPPRSLGGIVVDQLADSSGVHDPNPDNIYNNPDFINRK